MTRLILKLLKIGFVLFLILFAVGFVGEEIFDMWSSNSEKDRQYIYTGEEFRSTLRYSNVRNEFAYVSLSSCEYHWGKPDQLRSGGVTKYTSNGQGNELSNCAKNRGF